MGNKNNIIHGPANLTIDGQNVGFTTGGVVLRRKREFLDVEADQATGVIKKLVIMEKMTLSTTMLESTRANMLLAMDCTGSGSGDGEFGEASPVATEHSGTITGKAPNGGTRTYTFYRGVVAEDVEHVVGARDKVGDIPVTFELMKDSTKGDTFGYWVDA